MMPVWYPFLICFLITLSLTASLVSTLDCKFLQIRLPIEVSIPGEANKTDVEFDEFGIGVGIFSYEAIAVVIPPEIKEDGILEELILTGRLKTQRRCSWYRSAIFPATSSSIENDRMRKQRYNLFENDNVLSSVRICSIISLCGLFLTCITMWSTVVFKCLCGKTNPEDYGPRNLLQGVTTKKVRNRIVCFLLMLLLCLIVEGMKFTFSGISLCNEAHVMAEPPSNSSSFSLSQPGKCSLGRGFHLTIVSFASLLLATLLTILC